MTTRIMRIHSLGLLKRSSHKIKTKVKTVTGDGDITGLKMFQKFN